MVVAENIFRFHKRRDVAARACIEGAREISLAITMATMTTVIVFLPAALVEGEGQFFLVRLAMPICISVVASLVVALVLVPLAVYLTLPHNGHGEEVSATSAAGHQRLNDVLRGLYDHTMGRLNDFYERLLRKALRRRLDFALLLLVVLGATFALFGKHVEVVEQQEDEQRGFHIEVELPQDTTFEEAEQFFLACEKLVEARKDEYQLAGWFVFHRATVGEIEGWFGPDREDGPTAREITAALLKVLPEKPGVRFYTGEESEQEKEQKGTFRVPLYGEDIDRARCHGGRHHRSRARRRPTCSACARTATGPPRRWRWSSTATARSGSASRRRWSPPWSATRCAARPCRATRRTARRCRCACASARTTARPSRSSRTSPCPARAASSCRCAR